MKLKDRIYLFMFVLVLLILVDHFIGIPVSKGDLFSAVPHSWNNIFHNFFIYIIIASLPQLIPFKLLIKLQKESENRDMDAARKRIEERERKEKEESQEKDNKESNESEDEKR